MVTTVCLCVAQSCYYMQWESIYGSSLSRAGRWLAHSHIPWFIWKMPLSTQLGFVVSWAWHATHGISSRMIVRESHTGTLKNKQGLLERHTGCKHWSFYGKIYKRTKRERRREKRERSERLGQSKTSTERRKRVRWGRFICVVSFIQRGNGFELNVLRGVFDWLWNSRTLSTDASIWPTWANETISKKTDYFCSFFCLSLGQILTYQDRMSPKKPFERTIFHGRIQWMNRGV